MASCPPTFPFGAVVHRGQLAVLQVGAGQDVGGGAQQLLGAAALQAVVTAVGRPDTLGRAPQNPAVPAERTPGRTRSLTDSGARDHREVLTEALISSLVIYGRN